MKILKTLIWVGFVAVTLWLNLKTRSFNRANPTAYGIISFELAGKEEGKIIVKGWKDAGSELVTKARGIIWIDFLFVVFYTAVLIMVSNALMYHERSLVLNSLLRLNLLLSPLAGLMDTTENILMLRNLSNVESYFPSTVFAWIKFILAGWVILLCLLSIVKKAFPSGNSH